MTIILVIELARQRIIDRELLKTIHVTPLVTTDMTGKGAVVWNRDADQGVRVSTTIAMLEGETQAHDMTTLTVVMKAVVAVLPRGRHKLQCQMRHLPKRESVVGVGVEVWIGQSVLAMVRGRGNAAGRRLLRTSDQGHSRLPVVARTMDTLILLQTGQLVWQLCPQTPLPLRRIERSG